MTGLRYDPEYFKAIEPFTKSPKSAPAKTALDIRTNTNNIIGQVIGNSPYPAGVTETTYKVKSYDGIEIEYTRFASKECLASKDPTPAVVYLHGGAFIACSVKLFAPQIARLAANTNLPYFAVSYRLAPEHPAPTALEDAYAVLQHLLEPASAIKYNIDPTRIAVHGDSAGGGIAAGVCLLARDRKLEPPIAKQILIYPMLDNRMRIAEDDPSVKFMSWTPTTATIAWDAYLGKAPNEQTLPYAVPARATSLRSLPSTYIEVGTLDLFRDEDMEYARRLASDHVEVELHVWPGLPHGFDGVMGTSWYKRSQENRLDAIKRIGI
ncbi:lipase esterase [Fusarium beomiforme]|uniref:Lipase esterase n=1 Tax=Fusarium beomiforme TaxID=44412 RepID=A0A9P5AIA4_9HYPO|nr:lipase esterase [Fusarium beomiforme]